jgi:hypothetical protein
LWDHHFPNGKEADMKTHYILFIIWVVWVAMFILSEFARQNKE